MKKDFAMRMIGSELLLGAKAAEKKNWLFIHKLRLVIAFNVLPQATDCSKAQRFAKISTRQYL